MRFNKTLFSKFYFYDVKGGKNGVWLKYKDKGLIRAIYTEEPLMKYVIIN